MKYTFRPELEGEDEKLAVFLFHSERFGIARTAGIIGCGYTQVIRAWDKHGLKRSFSDSGKVFKKQPAISKKPTKAECLAIMRRGESL